MYRLLTLFILLTVGVAAHARILSGFAEADITPTSSEGLLSCMGGYGSPFARCGISESSSVIKASAVSIVDRDDILILVSLDTVGIAHSLKQDIIKAAKKLSRGRLQHAHILMSATHSHSGPDLQGLWGGVDQQYRDRVVNATARAIVQSFMNRSKAVAYTWAVEADIENRRGLSVVDNSVEILDLRSARYGHRIATIVNMSAHPTIVDDTNFTWSSDYVGHLRSRVDSSLNTNTLFINGIVGDAQPAIEGARGLTEAERYGLSMGELISDAASSATRLPVRTLTYSEVDFSHPIENPLFLGALQLGLLDVNVDQSNNILTQMGIIKLGKRLSIVVFPGEALTNIGVPMEQLLNTPHTMFFGLTGDSLGYFLPNNEVGSSPDSTTEESASISPTIGDSAVDVFESLLNDCSTMHCGKR